VFWKKKTPFPKPKFLYPKEKMSACSVSCSGFSSLRSECAANACVGNNLCYAIDPTITSTCAEWCCVSHNVSAFFILLLACVAAFAGMAGFYLQRLDEKNRKEKEETEAYNKRVRAMNAAAGFPAPGGSGKGGAASQERR
jgi:hypothetical protein